jgi:endoglucanase
MNPTVGKIAVTNLKYPIAAHSSDQESVPKNYQPKNPLQPPASLKPVESPKSVQGVLPGTITQPRETAPTGMVAQLKLKVTLQSEWDTGFCQQVVVENPGKGAVANWKLQFEMAQATIEKTWNGQFQQKGDRYEVTPPEWGRTIQPNQLVDMGFCAKKTVKEKGLARNFKIVKA